MLLPGSRLNLRWVIKVLRCSCAIHNLRSPCAGLVVAANPDTKYFHVGLNSPPPRRSWLLGSVDKVVHSCPHIFRVAFHPGHVLWNALYNSRGWSAECRAYLVRQPRASQ